MQENLTLEQQKKELQMTLSKFTHEIRNPVALIQSELQMLNCPVTTTQSIFPLYRQILPSF